VTSGTNSADGAATVERSATTVVDRSSIRHDAFGSREYVDPGRRVAQEASAIPSAAVRIALLTEPTLMSRVTNFRAAALALTERVK
jgi:hypothetical protein